jgi:DNA-binding LacI/PurR family transcriptional regulator
MGDIARMAGVSTATVSRALSANPAIPPATRERIAELARSLNYQVNVGAASLRKGRPNTVAVCILTEASQRISDPFVLSLVGQIADALHRQGFSMLLTRAHADAPEALAQSHDSGQAAGVIVIGQFADPACFTALALRGVPLAVWGAAVPGTLYPVVGTDNLLGGLRLTRHLLDQGCRRIAFVGEHDHPESQLRYEGYRQALQQAGLQPDPALCVSTPYDAGQAHEALARWLPGAPAFDAMVCVSDVIAVNAIALLEQRGLSIPGDVRVAGYDDVDMSRLLRPSLTTVRQPVDQAAQALVSALLASVAGEAPQSVLLPTELVVRDSTG